MPARTAVARVALALGVLVAVAGLEVAGLGVLPGLSASATGTSSPAGSYSATVYTSPADPSIFPLVLTRNGHFAFHPVAGGEAGPTGTWKEKGKALTMTATGKENKGWVFTIHQTATSLGSTSHPGNITVDGRHWGKWYATTG